MAIDVREIPVIGAFVSGGTVVVDVLIQGGDTILMLLITVLEAVELWLPLLTTLDRLAAEVPGVSMGWTSDLIMVGLVLMLAIRVARFTDYIKNRLQNDEN